MDSTRLVIIGAGVAGLSAGCYAARSGYRVTLLEMHDKPGGLCTSWRRKGYLFDGSVAGLAGTRRRCPSTGCGRTSESSTTARLRPRGLRHGRRAGRPAGDRVDRYIPSRGGVAGGVPCRRRGRPGVLRRGPRLRTGGPAIPDPRRRRRRAGMHCAARRRPLRTLPALLKYGRMTLREFTRRLTDPFAVLTFNNLVHFGGSDMPLLTVLLPLAYADRRATGIPRHGWLTFARAVEQRFHELGGVTRYGALVRGLVTVRRTSDRSAPGDRGGDRRRQGPVGGRRAVHPRGAARASRSGRSADCSTSTGSRTSPCR